MLSKGIKRVLWPVPHRENVKWQWLSRIGWADNYPHIEQKCNSLQGLQQSVRPPSQHTYSRLGGPLKKNIVTFHWKYLNALVTSPYEGSSPAVLLSLHQLTDWCSGVGACRGRRARPEYHGRGFPGNNHRAKTAGYLATPPTSTSAPRRARLGTKYPNQTNSSGKNGAEHKNIKDVKVLFLLLSLTEDRFCRYVVF